MGKRERERERARGGGGGVGGREREREAPREMSTYFITTFSHKTVGH